VAPVGTEADAGTHGARASGAVRGGVVWSVLSAELARRRGTGSASLDVLDLGGGSGVTAVPLAELGHRVTVVDTSADALATLQRRAADAGVADRVAPVQGEVERLSDAVGAAAYDLVLCHSLLEVVDDPAATLGTVAGALRPGGCASVLAAGRAATVLARALGGHPADALRALTDPAGRWGDADGVLRRFDTDGLVALVVAAGLRVEAVHGVRVVTDLVPGAVLDGEPGVGEALRELEAAVASRTPYRDLAAQLHVLARR
jgi:S-adenosylmethionine-dependent methyltransferase